MSLYSILIGIGFGYCLALTVYMLVKRQSLFGETPLYHEGKWSLPRKIKEKDLGQVEGGNKLLQEVIIVANMIEEPKNGLLEAVKKNLKAGVKYKFIISNSHYIEEKDRYILIFQAHANAAQSRQHTSDDLVTIHKLGREWDDFPYIFYRSKNGPESDNCDFYFAYKGSQEKEGIANSYQLLDPTMARTIFSLIEGAVGSEIIAPAPGDAFTSRKHLRVIPNIANE